MDELMLNNCRRRTRYTMVAMATSIAALAGIAAGPGLPGGAAPGDANTPTPAIPDRVIHLESATTGRLPSISGDGGRIVFVAPSAHGGLTADGGPLDSVWLRDRSSGALTELVPLNPSLRVGASTNPVISRDGCTVVMTTELALDLFRDDDTGRRWDVYRTVLPGCPGAFEPGEWQLVSTTSVGEPVARDDVDPAQKPAVSAAGTTIVYARRAVPDGDDLTSWTSLDVVDATIPVGDPGRVSTAPGLPLDLPSFALAPIGQADPAISDDGRYIAFTTDAVIESGFDSETLEEYVQATWPAAPVSAPEAIRPTTQIYRWDRTVNADEGGETFRLVSATAGGLPPDRSSGHAAISARGDIVAFTSLARDLDPLTAELPALPNSLGAATQVYVADLDPPMPPLVDGQAPIPPDAVIRLVSRTADSFGLGSSSAAQLDASGDTLVFATEATNLTGDDRRTAAAAGLGDVVVANLVHGGLAPVTMRYDGVLADLGAGAPVISSAARTIAFETVTGAQLLGANAEVPTGTQVFSQDLTPDLDVTPVDVGTVEVGQPSPEWKTRVVNNGPGSFVPDSIVSSDGAFAITGGSCTSKVALPAGSSCEIDVIFTPTTPGAAGSAIALTEAGFGAQQAIIYFSGVGGVPTIVANPPGQNLGDALVGTSAGVTAYVMVTNVGPYDEVMQPVQVGGANPGDFPVLDDRCSQVTVVPGGSCEVGIGFSPLDGGRRNAIVSVTTQGGATSSVVVSGTGAYRPAIAVGPAVVEEGESVSIGGLGFPAGGVVSLGWADTDERVTVQVADNGGFSVRLPVVVGGPTGRREIVVSDPADRFGEVRSAPVLVDAQRRAIPLRPTVRRP